MSDGQLDSPTGSSPPTQRGETVAAALAVGCSVPADAHNSLEFCLAWDMPKITFGSREREHIRYTHLLLYNHISACISSELSYIYQLPCNDHKKVMIYCVFPLDVMHVTMVPKEMQGQLFHTMHLHTTKTGSRALWNGKDPFWKIGKETLWN